MRVYCRETKSGVEALCWVTDSLVGCQYPNWAAVGLAFSDLCAMQGLRLVYQVPADMALRPVHMLPASAFRDLVATKARVGEEEAQPVRERVAGALPEVPVLGRGDLTVRLGALHEQMDRCLDGGDGAGARSVATLIARLRREFAA